jgi:hypothetical protein
VSRKSAESPLMSRDLSDVSVWRFEIDRPWRGMTAVCARMSTDWPRMSYAFPPPAVTSSLISYQIRDSRRLSLLVDVEVKSEEPRVTP